MEHTLINTVIGDETFEEGKWLRALFTEQLNEVYCMENVLIKTIPELIRHSSSEELTKALTVHFEISKNHLVRLDQIFSFLNETAVEESCRTLNGLIKETESVLEEAQSGLSLDASIILAGQKAEQFEISAYKSLYSLAKTMEEQPIADLLEETLGEEIEANEKLERIARSLVKAEYHIVKPHA